MLVVIPFREEGKSRLPEELRREVALAMLGDVVETAMSVGDVRVVTADAAGRLVADELGATVVDDPGEGQGPAVAAALEGTDGICLVLNADLPRVRPSDLAALAVPPKLGRVGIVASADERTNALGLPYPEVFRPLYGPRSARRFRAHVLDVGLDFEELALPNLVADVDTLADLGALGPRGGVRTRALVEAIAR
ncbi:MAG TPA: NTP transferase domain-containing protein [Gaiella sp.]|jgi:2-phospho-L-lactate guanylyltransferase